MIAVIAVHINLTQLLQLLLKDWFLRFFWWKVFPNLNISLYSSIYIFESLFSSRFFSSPFLFYTHSLSSLLFLTLSLFLSFSLSVTLKLSFSLSLSLSVSISLYLFLSVYLSLTLSLCLSQPLLISNSYSFNVIIVIYLSKIHVVLFLAGSILFLPFNLLANLISAQIKSPPYKDLSPLIHNNNLLNNLFSFFSAMNLYLTLFMGYFVVKKGIR